MGRKNFKGAVSITNDRGRIRLRWRYQSQRYSLGLSFYNKQNILQARKTALLIEQDIGGDKFDSTLYRYGGATDGIKPNKTIVKYFEEWTSSYKQMDCEKHTNYNSVRNMLRNLGED